MENANVDTATTYITGRNDWTEVLHSESELPESDLQSNVQIYSNRIPKFDHSLVQVLNEKVGEGGQGQVFKAMFYDRIVAAKVFRDTEVCQGHWPDALYGIDAMSQHICSIQGYVERSDGSVFLLMQLYNGDLRGVIDQEMEKGTNNGTPFRDAISMDLIIQTALGMKCLHDHDVIHRDLKASNILVFKDSEDNIPWGAQIGDFENAAACIGTRFWRAPEVLQALKDGVRPFPFTSKADVYSFGMTCYEILTGRSPLDDRPVSDYDFVLSGGRPELPANLNPKLKGLIERCWHHDPEARPTFIEIVRELREMVEGTKPFVRRFETAEEILAIGKGTLESNFLEFKKEIKALNDDYPGQDFSSMGLELLASIEQFESQFGFRSYVEHPSLPLSSWLERFINFDVLHYNQSKFLATLPNINKKVKIVKLLIVVRGEFFKGAENDKFERDDNMSDAECFSQWTAYQQLKAARSPVVDRHRACSTLKFQYMDVKDNQEVCEFCKDEPNSEKAISTFRLYPSTSIWPVFLSRLVR